MNQSLIRCYFIYHYQVQHLKKYLTETAVATLDCLASFALVAASSKYVRPELDEGMEIAIRGGRHPVIETLLPPGEAYNANDTILDAGPNQVEIITGPNISGKSSFLRQTGLIVLLAQSGSYVPAASAKIGIVDAIFTRVGASDNIASGESTFLVERHEAAHIVNAATRRSLILLDEVGRGTSTFDGISIAWALTERSRCGCDRRRCSTPSTHACRLRSASPRPRSA